MQKNKKNRKWMKKMLKNNTVRIIMYCLLLLLGTEMICFVSGSELAIDVGKREDSQIKEVVEACGNRFETRISEYMNIINIAATSITDTSNLQNEKNQEVIKELGKGKVLMLGLQHMFAMFGATVLVPLLTGLDVSTTLLFAGIGTLLFHLITKMKIPAFLGSSFAFLGGYFAIAPLKEGTPNIEMIPYACFGVACAGLVYLILAGLIKLFSAKKRSIYSSLIGDFLEFIAATFSGITSTATTSLCCASSVAIESPTYPVPATAIFIFRLSTC